VDDDYENVYKIWWAMLDLNEWFFKVRHLRLMFSICLSSAYESAITCGGEGRYLLYTRCWEDKSSGYGNL
jgi:hypothetical protein